MTTKLKQINTQLTEADLEKLNCLRTTLEPGQILTSAAALRIILRQYKEIE